jgi:hypothetical protein
VVGDPSLPRGRSRAELIEAYYKADVFTFPATGTLGNTPRNFLIGPGSRNVDLSLFRTFVIRQAFNLQFRVEAFNAFNGVNLGNPRSNIGAANPGRRRHGGRRPNHAARAQNDVLNPAPTAGRRLTIRVTHPAY